jgi:hypothetical protein
MAYKYITGEPPKLYRERRDLPIHRSRKRSEITTLD